MKTRSGAVSVSLSASLSKIYYLPGGYWKGYSAFSKLADAAGVSENEAKEWLKKQALWQIYLPSPRYIPRPHWTVDKPNEIHQADLLFLPHDTVRRKTFKYALVFIDVASRYKHIKLCFVVLKAWVEKQYKLSNLVSLSAGLGQRRSINKQNGGLGYLVFGCPLTSFALRKLGLFEFIFLNN